MFFDRHEVRLALAAVGFWGFVFGAQLQAAITYWDPTGATASANPDGAWENQAWSSTSALTDATVAWVPGTAAAFSAGTTATGAYTVTVDSVQSVAGIFNGLTAAIGTVTINGSGSLDIVSGLQGFSTPSPGSTIINVPLTGAAQMVIERSGQLYLNGTNSYSGGTMLGYSGAAFTGTVNVNNNASFGTGPITMYSSGCAIVLEGSAAVTIPNSIVAAPVTLNIVGNPAGLTFSGPWNMGGAGTNVNLGSGVSGNLVAISGVMSGGGGLNKYNPGILKLMAANTYTGPTTISNGSLALGPSGSINTTASLLIANGATFDVSAISSYTLGGSSTLIARGTGTSAATAANLKGASGGTVSLGARPINLNYTPTAFSGDATHPALYVSQGALTLNNNTITVTNAAATALGVGTYRLIQVGNGSSGTINGVPKATVSVLGNGLVAGVTASLVVSNGNVNLLVKPPAVFSGLFTSQSNSFGIGVVSVTIGGKVSAGSVYPGKNETVTISINGTGHPATINDSVGDFAFTFDPKSIPYASTNYNNVFLYPGNSVLAPATNTALNLAPHGFFAGDASPGFFGGMNLFFTNTSGIVMNTWSSTNAALPVTDWALESVMQEQPLNDGTGRSRYSLNVNPAITPAYFICGPSITWPFLSPTTVQMITSDVGDYSIASTTITASGVLGLPAAPIILQQPVAQTLLAGKNATFSALATGSPALSYQWFSNTLPISAGSTSTFVVTNVTVDSTATYSCVVTNSYGSASSSAATLTVLPPPELSMRCVSNVLQVGGAGISGNSYWVQAASNITPPINWVTVATNIIGSNGSVSFTDTNPPAQTSRFYRVVFP